MNDFAPQSPENGSATNAAGRECFVVCVDDDPEFVKSLELFLPDRINEGSAPGHSHRFLFFTDPRDALESLTEIVSAQEPLAMVISDQQMPQMKGTAFLARIRERYPECVRVLLTGHAGLESAITAINERLLDKYLTKPVDNEHDFTISIKLLLQRFWMQRTIAAQQRTLGDLFEFSNTLNALSSLDSTLEQVATFARSALNCGHASAWLIEGDELVLATHAPGSVPPARARLDGSMIERLAGSRMARIETLAEAPWFGGLAGSDVEARPACPFSQATLYAGQETLGILVVGDKATGPHFDARDEEILTYIADTASIAVSNRLQSNELERAYNDSRKQAIALQGANERLRLLDKLKNDFLSFVSHELRTPLTVLAGVELLQPAGDRPDQVELTAALREGYERLRRFIETALEYGSWIAGERARAFEQLDFSGVVGAASKEIRDSAERAVEVQVSVTDLPCPVRGNRSDLADVVRILLGNAVKFSPDGKPIRVTCEVSEAHVGLVVADQGVGFDPELAEELLKPFTIADILHHQSGSGLHLAKAAAIVIAHGGDLRAKSPGPGLGATFTVRLPLANPGPGNADSTLLGETTRARG